MKNLKNSNNGIQILEVSEQIHENKPVKLTSSKKSLKEPLSPARKAGVMIKTPIKAV